MVSGKAGARGPGRMEGGARATDEGVGAEKRRGGPPAEFSQELVRDVSIAVYRHELGEAGYARMLEGDNDGGKKMRNRAGAYDKLTRTYLHVFKNMGVKNG